MQDPRFVSSSAAASAEMISAYVHMLGVYNYMATALGVTGLFAFGTKMMAVTGPDGQLYATGFGNLLFNTPLMWVVALAPLGMVFWLSSRLLPCR